MFPVGKGGEGGFAELLTTLERVAMAEGALGVWPADPLRMPVRAWVRFQCRYGCPDHGRWLTCPPHAPSLEFAERLLGEYGRGIWVCAAGHAGVNRILRALRKVTFESGRWKALALGAGHCDLCEECELGGCRHPRGVFPSLEALGVSVIESLELHGIDSGHGGGFPCFGALLVE